MSKYASLTKCKLKKNLCICGFYNEDVVIAAFACKILMSIFLLMTKTGSHYRLKSLISRLRISKGYIGLYCIKLTSQGLTKHNLRLIDCYNHSHKFVGAALVIIYSLVKL